METKMGIRNGQTCYISATIGSFQLQLLSLLNLFDVGCAPALRRVHDYGHLLVGDVYDEEASAVLPLGPGPVIAQRAGVVEIY